MNELGTKKLETKRLILRRFDTDDYKAMYNNWAKYEECSRYFPWNKIEDIDTAKERMEHWVNNYKDNTYFQWGIELKENNEMIGAINLHNADTQNNSAETSYLLSPKYWSRGIMTEALAEVIRFAFEELELNRITADYFSGNEQSAKVMKKNNMKYEGTNREMYYKNGKYIDSIQYSILRREWISK